MYEELNKKLAEWRWTDGKRLGFLPNTGDILWGTKQEQHWINFPQSPSDCFKWLVSSIPNLVEISFSYRDYIFCHVVTEEGYEHIYHSEEAETEALAFCLAIEKLIDAEKV